MMKNFHWISQSFQIETLELPILVLLCATPSLCISGRVLQLKYSDSSASIELPWRGFALLTAPSTGLTKLVPKLFH